MKIEKTMNWRHKPKFLKIKLLKTQTYKNTESFRRLKIENIEHRLKKILHIINQFHINNKTILFVGTPVRLHKQMKKLLLGTKHALIPYNTWVNGAITNRHKISKYILKMKGISKTQTETLFQLKKKSDLIVILNEKSNQLALDESYISKTPTITLNSSLDITNNKSIYKVPGNFSFTSKKIGNSLFYTILKATLKKRNKNILTTLKLNQEKNVLELDSEALIFQKLVQNLMEKEQNDLF